MTSEIFVGIDVAQEKLDVHILPSKEEFQVKNTLAGVEQLIQKFSSQLPKLIVLEATGGLERMAFRCLTIAGFEVVLANPRQIRRFAGALGISAKTDRLDASVIALFGERIQPQVRPLPSQERMELADLHGRCHQLKEMRTAEKNRLSRADKIVCSGIEEHIVWLNGKIKEMDDQMNDHLSKNADLQDLDKILQQVPSIGPVVSRVLIAYLPELGHVSNKAISALVGVAPFNKDSGTIKGKRFICGGRLRVRNALYMSALVGITHNPVIHNYYEHLLHQGKPKKVALIACMRKLLVMVNSMIRSGTAWCPPLR